MMLCAHLLTWRHACLNESRTLHARNPKCPFQSIHFPYRQVDQTITCYRNQQASDRSMAVHRQHTVSGLREKLQVLERPEGWCSRSGGEQPTRARPPRPLFYFLLSLRSTLGAPGLLFWSRRRLSPLLRKIGPLSLTTPPLLLFAFLSSLSLLSFVATTLINFS